MTRISRSASLVVLGVLVLCGGRAWAATRTFQGTQSASWSVAANWQDSQKPVAGDDVVIAADCTVDEDTPPGPCPSPKAWSATA